MEQDLDFKLDRIEKKIEDISDCVNKIDKDVVLHKAAFDNHLAQDERMYEEFRRMNDILQQNTDSLKEHMHRTHLLEAIVEKMDNRLSPLEESIKEQEIISRYRKDLMIKLIKIVGAMAGLSGIIMSLKSLIIKILAA